MSLTPSTTANASGLTSAYATPAYASGGSGGGSTLQPPTVTFGSGGYTKPEDGSHIGVVGGAVSVGVTPAAGEQLRSVTYTVAGAVQGQNYSWQSGATPRLTNPVSHNQPAVDGDNLAWNWDETSGNHTITVQATYPEGNAPLVTINVDVRKPVVTKFRDESSSFDLRDFVNGASNQYGLSQGNSFVSPGNRFSATVDTTGLPTDGKFAIIQLTTIKRQINYDNGGGNVTYTQNSSGYVLDNDTSTGLDVSKVTYAGYTSPSVPPDSVGVAIPAASYVQNMAFPAVKGALVDSPFQGFVPRNNDPMQTGYTRISIDDTFQSYLVFQPGDGVWIALSMISWHVNGVVSKGSTSWGIDMPIPTTLTPTSSSPLDGNGNTSLVSWTGCASPSSPNPPGTPQLPPGVGTFWMSGNSPLTPPAN